MASNGDYPGWFQWFAWAVAIGAFLGMLWIGPGQCTAQGEDQIDGLTMQQRQEIVHRWAEP